MKTWTVTFRTGNVIYTSLTIDAENQRRAIEIVSGLLDNPHYFVSCVEVPTEDI